MPISENELMWGRTLPDEVEADPVAEGAARPLQRAEVVDRLLPLAEGEGAAPEQTGDELLAGEAEPPTRLEATLERLERSALEMKVYLDSIEQRISRLEPMVQSISHGAVGREEVVVTDPMTSPEPAVAVAASPEPAADPVEPAAESKGRRWTHLMANQPGMLSEEGWAEPVITKAEPAEGGEVAPEIVAVAPEMLAPAPEVVAVGPPVVAAAIEAAPVEAKAVEQAGAGRFGRGRDGVAAAMDGARPAIAEGAATEGSGPRPGPREVPRREDRVATVDAPRVVRRAAVGTDDLPRPVRAEEGGREAAEQEMPRRQGRTPEWSGRLLPEREADREAEREAGSETQRRLSPEWEDERDRARSGVWRGYRVRHLVLGAVLLLLALIPLAIWWRMSTEARDLDPAEPATSSSVEHGLSGVAGRIAGRVTRVTGLGRMTARPGATGGAARPGTTGDRSAGSANGADTAGVSLSGTDARAGGAVRGTRDGSPAPIVRVPATSGGVGVGTGAELAGGTGLRTRPAATASTLAGGADGGVIPGSTAMRVRVSSGVMAAKLLPTPASVGEGPSAPRGSGEVEAMVYISNTGRVENVEVISGDQGLRSAAERAMRTWRYEPYVQGGVRVPVVTTAAIQFGGGMETP